jgi:hypothetical protein
LAKKKAKSSEISVCGGLLQGRQGENHSLLQQSGNKPEEVRALQVRGSNSRSNKLTQNFHCILYSDPDNDKKQVGVRPSAFIVTVFGHQTRRRISHCAL